MEKLDKETYLQIKLRDEKFKSFKVKCIEARKICEKNPEQKARAAKEIQELLEIADEGTSFKGLKPSDFVETISPELVKSYKDYIAENLFNNRTGNADESDITDFIESCITAICTNIFLNSDVLDQRNAKLLIATLVIEDFAKKELISLRDALNFTAYFHFKYSGILDAMYQSIDIDSSQKSSSNNPIDDLLEEIENTVNKKSDKNLL